MRCIIALLALLAWSTLALGAESDGAKDFASAMEPVMANLRTAASYARTGNTALAQMETEEAVTAWKRLETNASSFPSPHTAAPLTEFLSRGGERLGAVAHALDSGDNVAAGRELQLLRQSFHQLRRQSGLYDLGDCVFEIAPAMEKLRIAATRFGEQPAPAHAGDTVAAAGVLRDRLQRCNDWARADIAERNEFRRLIDGAIASSSEIAHAAMAGDGPLVHRYLIELQSYAQLLDFRFG
ncbi:hypothetical protein GCM10010987_47770 [Bradyrhizobium guangdongense]|uniref:NarX-like N-terminal domain-containing protein n=3 Tax=Bradyrhizobium guangdongense TaxID=1325090 RepID=A0AA87W865_9BRAD|nr:hypothetical protein GCM10010987_47770 [Bradyrhizobium guangdongense]